MVNFFSFFIYLELITKYLPFSRNISLRNNTHRFYMKRFQNLNIERMVYLFRLHSNDLMHLLT